MTPYRPENSGILEDSIFPVFDRMPLGYEEVETAVLIVTTMVNIIANLRKY